MAIISFQNLSLRAYYPLIFLFFVQVLTAQNAVAPVSMSVRGGVFQQPVSVQLTCTTNGAKIYYTLDGSEPTQQSQLYQLPLKISQNTPLRARAFFSPREPSKISTETYLFNVNHSFSIVSLVFKHDDFFGANGIYTLFQQPLSAVANFEFFENQTSKSAINQLVEVEIQGTASALNPQKSLEIKAKKSLGEEWLNFPFFPQRDFKKYKRVVLRNSGQDWGVTQFRDVFGTDLIANLQDLDSVVATTNIFWQGYRPAVLYLNGKFWGIQEVRERMNRFFVEQHFQWKSDDFDLIENFNEVQTGNLTEWLGFENWLQTSDFQLDANFNALRHRIDYPHFLDYCVFNVLIDNTDWPGNNNRRFRHRSPEGKWRWLTYDLDFTFGLHETSGAWNTGNPTQNALQRLLTVQQNHPNPEWATLLFRKLWQNEQFRRDFANRSADFLNTLFHPQRVSQRLDFWKKKYEPEILQHLERWGFGADFLPTWLQNIEKVRSFSQKRPDFVRHHIVSAIATANKSVELTVDAQPRNGGTVHLSTLQLRQPHFPFLGQYFAGIPIPVQAVAAPGYKFVGWNDPVLGNQPQISLQLLGKKQLTAIFEKDNQQGGGAEPAVVAARLFPNPATDATTLFLRKSIGKNVKIDWFDAAGKFLDCQTFENLKSDMLPLDVSQLPRGVLTLKIQIDELLPLGLNIVLH